MGVTSLARVLDESVEYVYGLQENFEELEGLATDAADLGIEIATYAGGAAAMFALAPSESLLGSSRANRNAAKAAGLVAVGAAVFAGVKWLMDAGKRKATLEAIEAKIYEIADSVRRLEVVVQSVAEAAGDSLGYATWCTTNSYPLLPMLEGGAPQDSTQLLVAIEGLEQIETYSALQYFIEGVTVAADLATDRVQTGGAESISEAVSILMQSESLADATEKARSDMFWQLIGRGHGQELGIEPLDDTISAMGLAEIYWLLTRAPDGMEGVVKKEVRSRISSYSKGRNIEKSKQAYSTAMMLLGSNADLVNGHFFKWRVTTKVGRDMFPAFVWTAAATCALYVAYVTVQGG